MGAEASARTWSSRIIRYGDCSLPVNDRFMGAPSPTSWVPRGPLTPGARAQVGANPAQVLGRIICALRTIRSTSASELERRAAPLLSGEAAAEDWATVRDRIAVSLKRRFGRDGSSDVGR